MWAPVRQLNPSSATSNTSAVQPCHFVWDMYKKRQRYSSAVLQCKSIRQTQLINHLEGNGALVTKKGLLQHMERHFGSSLTDYVPESYLIGNVTDESFSRFSASYAAVETAAASHLESHPTAGPDSARPVAATERPPGLQNIWIVKPAVMTNRGTGISVVNSVEAVRSIVVKGSRKGRQWIVQRYMETPLLVHGRKFDIRCFVLVTVTQGGKGLRGYLYDHGYVRTSSRRFSLRDLSDRTVHLTNDAVQNKSKEYGKYEDGNKLTYPEFAAILDQAHKGDGDRFFTEVVPRIRDLVQASLTATAARLNSKRRQSCFELLGYDFMVDQSFGTYLIEVNSNPCLELSSPYLAGMLPRLIEHMLQLTVDVHFPPPPPPRTEKRGSANCQQAETAEQDLAAKRLKARTDAMARRARLRARNARRQAEAEARKQAEDTDEVTHCIDGDRSGCSAVKGVTSLMARRAVHSGGGMSAARPGFDTDEYEPVSGQVADLAGQQSVGGLAVGGSSIRLKGAARVSRTVGHSVRPELKRPSSDRLVVASRPPTGRVHTERSRGSDTTIETAIAGKTRRASAVCASRALLPAEPLRPPEANSASERRWSSSSIRSHSGAPTATSSVDSRTEREELSETMGESTAGAVTARKPVRSRAKQSGVDAHTAVDLVDVGGDSAGPNSFREVFHWVG